MSDTPSKLPTELRVCHVVPDHGVRYITTEAGTEVAVIYEAEDEVVAAAVKLMVAAPKLLDALRELADHIDSDLRGRKEALASARAMLDELSGASREAKS